MRQLKCKTTGFSSAMVGRVTYGDVSRQERGDCFLVLTDTGRHNSKGYRGVLTDRKVSGTLSSKHHVRQCILDGDTSDCHEGDVLFVEPTRGTATFLYEAGSRDNAILVTERCNCKCVMCPQPPQHEPETRTDFNLELIRLMSPGPLSLAFTGGEPTLVGEDLLRLLSECRTRLPNTDVIILTNGRRFRDRKNAESIARVGHPRLTIAVALYADFDTLHDEIVGTKGAFNDTVRGLYNLALYGFIVEIRVVILALNFRRLPKIVDFIYSHFPFAAHVALMGLETTGLAAANLDRVWVDPHDYREEIEESCRHLSRRMIPVSVYNHALCVLPKSVWPFAWQTISSWKNVYVPECDRCGVRGRCGGFFESSSVRRSSYVRAIAAKDQDIA